MYNSNVIAVQKQKYQPPNYMLKSTQNVSVAVGHRQAKLEQSLGIFCLRTLWDPISFTLLITLNAINRLKY